MSGFCFAIPLSSYQALFAVPLATLQSLQAGQGIPTGTPGHLLVKTETGQYQILRVGPPGATPAAAGAQPAAAQQQSAARPPAATPPAAAAAAAPAIRLPTQPVAMSRPPQQQPSSTATTAAAPAAAASPAVSAAAAAGPGGMGGMGQQMTPDTAKIKCKNFLATLLRLASEQPESVARNVRTLIQVRRATLVGLDINYKRTLAKFAQSRSGSAFVPTSALAMALASEIHACY